MLFGRSSVPPFFFMLPIIILAACSSGSDSDRTAGVLLLAPGDGRDLALLKNPTRTGKLTSGFGYRQHPITGLNRPHRGIDLAAPSGTPVIAAEDGMLLFQGPRGTFGNLSTIKHGHHVVTAYAHLDRFELGLVPGMRVAKGQVIGYVGTSGRSSGPHLHYEVVLNGRRIDPLGLEQGLIAGLDDHDERDVVGGLLASLGQVR